MSGAEILFIAAAAGSAYMGIQGAKAQKKMYDAQAKQVELQATQKANNSKQQAVNVLKKLNSVMATNVAKGGAGNLDPYSSGDSTDIINTASLRDGVTDFTIARDNATMALKMGKYQADNYRFAGKVAVQQAKMSAVIQMASAGATVGMVNPTAFGGSATASTMSATDKALIMGGSSLGTSTVAPPQYYAPNSTAFG